VLAAATSAATDKLGRGATGIGRIAVGGPADLLILTEDPRNDLTALACPEHIVAAGRVI
jgi:imidazolonepropionase-like amidohydrolase